MRGRCSGAWAHARFSRGRWLGWKRRAESERPVGDGDAGEVAAHRGRRPDLGHGVHEGRDRLRFRRQCPFPAYGTPLGVNAEIGPDSSLGIAAERAPGCLDEASELLRERWLTVLSSCLRSVERGFEIHPRASGPSAYDPPDYSR